MDGVDITLTHVHVEAALLDNQTVVLTTKILRPARAAMEVSATRIINMHEMYATSKTKRILFIND